VRSNGWIKLEGILRFIGRAFVRQRIGLQPLDQDSWNVYLEALLIGTLHRSDGSGSLRAAQFCQPEKRPKTPPKKSPLL